MKAPQREAVEELHAEQAKALLAASVGTRLHAYVVLSLLVGIRTEEARALRWDHVVTWVDDPVGWQPVSSAGFDPSQAGDVWRPSWPVTTTRGPNGRASPPRPSHPPRLGRRW